MTVSIMRKILIITSALVITVLIIVGFTLFSQTSPATPQSSAPEELPTEETPTDLLVIPEIPLGTLTIMLACFSALIASQMKHKVKLH